MLERGTRDQEITIQTLKQNKSTVNEQICSAIEQLAVGWIFFRQNRGKKFPLNRLIDVLQKSRKKESANEQEDIKELNKTYQNHRKKLQDLYKIKIDFQKRTPKSLDKFDQIADLIKLYGKNNFSNYNDKLIINYIITQKNSGRLDFGLYLPVFFNLSIQLGLTVDIVCDSIHGRFTDKSFRLKPLAIVCRNKFLEIFAIDLSDGKKKHFAAVSIKEIKTNLLESAYFDSMNENRFNYLEYIQSDEYKNKIKIRTYTVKIQKRKFTHFTNAFFSDYEIQSESENEIVLKISTNQKKLLFQSLIFYENEIQLLAPKESIQEYRNLLIKSLNVHSA